MKEAKTNYKTYSLVEPRGITGQKIKEYPCLFDKRKKRYKKRHFSKIFSLSKTFAIFSRFYYLFEVLKT